MPFLYISSVLSNYVNVIFNESMIFLGTKLNCYVVHRGHCPLVITNKFKSQAWCNKFMDFKYGFPELEKEWLAPFTVMPYNYFLRLAVTTCVFSVVPDYKKCKGFERLNFFWCHGLVCTMPEIINLVTTENVFSAPFYRDTKRFPKGRYNMCASI